MQGRQGFSALTWTLWSYLGRVFAFLVSLIPGMVENPVTGTVQQSIPDFTSEIQPMACRESSADYVALNVVGKRYLVPKNACGSSSHTGMSSLSVPCEGGTHRGLLCAGSVTFVLSETVNAILWQCNPGSWKGDFEEISVNKIYLSLWELSIL